MGRGGECREIDMRTCLAAGKNRRHVRWGNGKIEESCGVVVLWFDFW